MAFQKYTFVVDVVTDSPVGIDSANVSETLAGAVGGVGQFSAVHPVKVEALKEQGLKVWAKRVAGISLATPKVKKVKAPKVEVEAETVTA